MKSGILSAKVVHFLLSLTTNDYSQFILRDQKITLSFKNIYLESLLDRLRATYSINTSYSPNNPPLNMTINVKSLGLPLLPFISGLCRKTGLIYEIRGDIVLAEKAPPKMEANTGFINPEDNATAFSPRTTIDFYRTTPPSAAILKYFIKLVMPDGFSPEKPIFQHILIK